MSLSVRSLDDMPTYVLILTSNEEKAKHMENVKQITLTVADEVLRGLDARAESEYRSRSNLATKIIAEALGLSRNEQEAKAQ